MEILDPPLIAIVKNRYFGHVSSVNKGTWVFVCDDTVVPEDQTIN